MQGIDNTDFTSITFSKQVKSCFLSVVIPVYKDVKGLEHTLKSLMQQTLRETEYEIIVCNDGGNSSISDICRAYAVQEISITPNRGSYNARNRGVDEAVGEYIAFVDADVTVPEQWLECGKKELQAADYVGGPVIINKEETVTPAQYHDSVTSFKGNEPGNRHNFFVTANLFVRRKVFEKLGGFDERLRSGGDNEFGNRVHRSGLFTQSFSEEIPVLHPPRDFRDLVHKRVRISQGKLLLNRLYPDRYHFRKPSLLKMLVGLFVPPSISGVKRMYSKNENFGFVKYYFFMWHFKIRVNLGLLPVYYEIKR